MHYISTSSLIRIMNIPLARQSFLIYYGNYSTEFGLSNYMLMKKLVN